MSSNLFELVVEPVNRTWAETIFPASVWFSALLQAFAVALASSSNFRFSSFSQLAWVWLLFVAQPANKISTRLANIDLMLQPQKFVISIKLTQRWLRIIDELASSLTPSA